MSSANERVASVCNCSTDPEFKALGHAPWCSILATIDKANLADEALDVLEALLSNPNSVAIKQAEFILTRAGRR